MTKKETPLDSCGFYHGLVYEYFNSGPLSSTMEYKHGIRHGKTIDYRPNGSLIYTANFVEGKIHGVVKHFFNNNLFCRATFYNYNIEEGELICFDY